MLAKPLYVMACVTKALVPSHRQLAAFRPTQKQQMQHDVFIRLKGVRWIRSKGPEVLSQQFYIKPTTTLPYSLHHL